MAENDVSYMARLRERIREGIIKKWYEEDSSIGFDYRSVYADKAVGEIFSDDNSMLVDVLIRQGIDAAKRILKEDDREEALEEGLRFLRDRTLDRRERATSDALPVRK